MYKQAAGSFNTERAGVAVTLMAHIQELLCSNLVRGTRCPGFPLSLPPNAWMVPRLGQDSYFPNHQSSAIHPFGSVV
jgi:hypothetical protein